MNVLENPHIKILPKLERKVFGKILMMFRLEMSVKVGDYSIIVCADMRLIDGKDSVFVAFESAHPKHGLSKTFQKTFWLSGKDTASVIEIITAKAMHEYKRLDRVEETIHSNKDMPKVETDTVLPF